MKHIVYGNGESRPKDKIIGGEWVATWGCNAIYRDFTVDNLVSVDYGMQQEIYESGYALKNKCWFTDWEILPPIDTSMIALGEGVPVYETEQNGKQLCVIQGNTHFTPEDAIKDMMKENPNIDESDVRAKCNKDVGLYITWIEKNDMVERIQYPLNWSAGHTAAHLACQSGAEELYMCGFDGSTYESVINNIYKGTKNYLSADSRGFNTINWDNQYRMIQRDFPNVKLYKVGTDLTYEELYNNIR